MGDKPQARGTACRGSAHEREGAAPEPLASKPHPESTAALPPGINHAQILVTAAT
jgi:hypothetical protein